MKLQSLNVSRGWQEGNPLKAVVTFKSEHGDVTLNLDEELSAQILEVCAGEIVKASKQVAETLTAEVINRNLIEHKEEGSE